MTVRYVMAVEIGGEGLLVTDRLRLPGGLDGSRVFTARQGGQVPAVGDAHHPAQRVDWHLGQVPDGGDAEAVEPAGGGRADPPQGAHGQWVEEADLVVRQHDHDATTGTGTAGRCSGLGRA